MDCDLCNLNLPTLCGDNTLTKETAKSTKIVGSPIQPIYERAGDVVKPR